MAEKKRGDVIKPAPIVSQSEASELERIIRQYTARDKAVAARLRQEGKELAEDIRQRELEASEHSLVATTVIQLLLDPAITKAEKFSPGKRKGAVKKATAYLIKLATEHPNASAKELFRIACEKSRLESTPFEYDHADGGCLWDGDELVDLKRFSNRLSKAKKRHMR